LILKDKGLHELQEFNIENANQSDYSRFLGILAALYLPITYLTVSIIYEPFVFPCINPSDKPQSIFGISTLTAPAILCLYISIPLLIISLFFTIFFPWAIRRFQKLWYPVDNNNVKLPKSSFTMLSEELPAVSDALLFDPNRLANIREIERRCTSSHRHPGSKLASPTCSSPESPQAQQ